MQPELKGGGLDAHPRVGQTAGHTQRHCDVSLLGQSTVSRQVVGIQRMLIHEVIDEHSCAGSDLPVDEPQAVPNQIREGTDEPRVLAPDHQSLHASRTADQFMPPWLEQRL